MKRFSVGLWITLSSLTGLLVVGSGWLTWKYRDAIFGSGATLGLIEGPIQLIVSVSVAAWILGKPEFRRTARLILLLLVGFGGVIGSVIGIAVQFHDFGDDETVLIFTSIIADACWVVGLWICGILSAKISDRRRSLARQFPNQT